MGVSAFVNLCFQDSNGNQRVLTIENGAFMFYLYPTNWMRSGRQWSQPSSVVIRDLADLCAETRAPFVSIRQSLFAEVPDYHCTKRHQWLEPGTRNLSTERTGWCVRDIRRWGTQINRPEKHGDRWYTTLLPASRDYYQGIISWMTLMQTPCSYCTRTLFTFVFFLSEITAAIHNVFWSHYSKWLFDGVNHLWSYDSECLSSPSVRIWTLR